VSSLGPPKIIYTLWSAIRIIAQERQGDKIMPKESERLIQQFQFLMEIDKLKEILRQSHLVVSKRRENSAEHCWHLAITTWVLAEYAEEAVNLWRVVKMALIHDIVEIDAGDVYIYDSYDEAVKFQQEQQAATRIFSLLPVDQATEFRELWEEFEARTTPDARFAGAVDRLMPLLHNYYTQGLSWQEHGITSAQVYARNRDRIANGSTKLWQAAEALIHDALEKGYLAKSP
jgi:putative hydrolase of HD superfamily